jgi:hypothetical protein
MDLTDLSQINGDELTDDQLRGILTQIDLDVTNLLRDGKLAALKASIGGSTGPTTDRAANLHALLAARDLYRRILNDRPAWETSRGSG